MKLKAFSGIMLILLLIGALTSLFNIQQVNAQEEGLIAYFPFNGNANDESGNNHDGTVHGATLTTDRFGNPNSAYSFDGNDDYVEILDDASFDFGIGGFTVSAWIKTDATTTTGTGRDDILAKGDPTISGFAISIRSNRAVFWTGDSGEFYGSSVLNDGEWHHVVATRDDSGNAALYVDGVSEYTGISNENVDTDYNVFIGKHGTGNESYFDGLIDDVSIYDRAVVPGPPSIVVLSPQNTTYTTSSVPLTFTVSGAISWMGYCLDEQVNITIAGNTTLTGLSDGAYILIVWASDTAGNMGYSDVVYFNVDTTPPTVLHELDIHLEVPMYLKLGDSSLLNVTVYNYGSSNETDVKLYLMVNGTTANDVTIPQLVNGTSYTFTHLWAPTVEATYNLTAYVLPVPGETNTDNNRLSQMISVYEPVWYRDTEKNFEILVPHGWTYESDVEFDTDIADVVLYGPIEDGFMVNIQVVSGFEPEIKETETYLVDNANEVIDIISSEFGDLQVIQSPTCTTINGQAAVTYVFQYQYESFTIKQKQAIIVSDERDYFWITTATAAAGNYEKYESTFDATIESFKVQALPSPSLSFWWVLPVIAVIIFIAVAVIVLIRRRKKSISPEVATPTETPTQLVTEEKIEEAPSVEARKRPTGLTIIAILWFLGGIYNLYMSSQVIGDDLEVLPQLSEPWVAEWFKFGVPAELAVNLLVFALGLIQLFTIIGLWTGKSWSYKLALAIPVLGAVSWISMAGLYMSAPIELGIRESINWVPIGASILWIALYWSYLRKPHVKDYLGV